jgi:crotonobetainyl-CoA:carnitine CoA-transferase CaiB-like acyl-CoA transferase
LLRRFLAARLRDATATEWAEKLRPLGLAVGAVLTLEEALESDQVQSRGMVVSVSTDDGPLYLLGSPIRFDGEPPEYRPPPRLHEHTDEVLHPARKE